MKELFAYSLMASALGIVIVFVLLILLSTLMVLIRFFSDDFRLPEKKKTEPAPPPAKAAKAGEEPDWLKAAVAAYLGAEDSDGLIPSAAPWSPSESERFDRWLDPGRQVNRK